MVTCCSKCMHFTCVTLVDTPRFSIVRAEFFDVEAFIVKSLKMLLRFLTWLLSVCSALFLIVSLLFSFTDLILAEGNSSSLSITPGTTFITGPYLDGNGISNVTTQISTHAYLPCKVSRASLLIQTPWHDFSFSCQLFLIGEGKVEAKRWQETHETF